MGLLDNFGLTNSMVLKNIKAYYYSPKTELKYKEDSIDINSMSLNDLKALVPDNFYETKNSYVNEDPIVVYGKDGQTNAYVKRGLDSEVFEYLEAQETVKEIWHFVTDDTVELKAGGKLQAKGRDWYILKVINQDTIGTEQNKFNAMMLDPLSDRHKLLGQKTLVLV